MRRRGKFAQGLTSMLADGHHRLCTAVLHPPDLDLWVLYYE